jgi:signal transduction histidine kinase
LDIKLKNNVKMSIRWRFILIAFVSGVLVIVSLLLGAFLLSILEIRLGVDDGFFAFLLLAMFSIFLFVVFYLILSQKSIRYLEEITSALQKIAEGRFDIYIPPRTSDELGRLAININIMEQKLKQSIDDERNAEKAKNELITSVSHDLRTPLTSIIGYLQLIVNDSYRDEVEMRHYIDIVFSKSLRLKKLIDDLFEFTKYSGTGIRLNITRLNLGGLLEQLAEEFVPIFDEAGMKYRISTPQAKVFISADGDLLARVYENLISNAIRYGMNGKYVDIELSTAGRDAVVRVANYGTEIPESELSNIFEKFYRIEKSRSENTGGTGLGLSIAKSIIQLHKGSICAYNQMGRTVFETRLPVQG